MENQYANNDAGGRLKGTEYGAALAPDDEGRLLEQHNSSRGHKEGEEQAQQPAPETCGHHQFPGDNAGDQGEGDCDCRHIEAEHEACDALVPEVGDEQDVGGVGKAGSQGQHAACQVQRLTRGVKQGHAQSADNNAYYIAHLQLFLEKQYARHNHDRGIDEVENGGCAGGDELVGRKKQYRCRAAAHKGYYAQ